MDRHVITLALRCRIKLSSYAHAQIVKRYPNLIDIHGCHYSQIWDNRGALVTLLICPMIRWGSDLVNYPERLNLMSMNYEES